MIKVEPCKGCGGVLLVDRFMGLTVRCEATPLDAQAAGAALLAGQELHRVLYLGGRPSSFSSASPAVLGALRGEPSERPMVVVTHRCTAGATGARLTASQEVGGTQAPKAPQSPPAGRGTPFSGHSSPSSTAHTAAKHPSKTRIPPTFVDGQSIQGPRCSGCGQPCADGTYASIELGDILIWAIHTEGCGS